MITNNSGMLEAFPGTQPKLARSWRLLLEEVSLIYERETFNLKEGRSTTCDGLRLSTNQRWCFKAVHQLKACSWASMSLATSLNLEWRIVAQARLNCCVFGYKSEHEMRDSCSSSLDLMSKLVHDHHFPPYQGQGEMMAKTQLQVFSISMNKF